MVLIMSIYTVLVRAGTGFPQHSTGSGIGNGSCYELLNKVLYLSTKPWKDGEHAKPYLSMKFEC
jgi:hypothetical protein